MLGNLLKSQPFSPALTDKLPRKLPRYNSRRAMEDLMSVGYGELILHQNLWSLLSTVPSHSPRLLLYIFPAIRSFQTFSLTSQICHLSLSVMTNEHILQQRGRGWRAGGGGGWGFFSCSWIVLMAGVSVTKTQK